MDIFGNFKYSYFGYYTYLDMNIVQICWLNVMINA